MQSLTIVEQAMSIVIDPRKTSGEIRTPSGLKHGEPLVCVLQGDGQTSPAFGRPIHVLVGTVIEPDGGMRWECNNHYLTRSRFVVPAYHVTGNKILIEPIMPS